MAAHNTRPLRMADLTPDWPTAPRLSDWLVISQAEIEVFGHLTRDPDPNHIDPIFAQLHSPFGGPIAFGFQTLAMLTYLLKSAGAMPEDAVHVVNYGFNKIRFIAPIPAGASVRGRFTITSVTVRKPLQLLVEYDANLELQGQDRPALAAEWLALYEGGPA